MVCLLLFYFNCVSYLKLKLDFKNKKDYFRDDSVSMLEKLKNIIEGKQEIFTDMTDKQVNKWLMKKIILIRPLILNSKNIDQNIEYWGHWF